jgi:hypothetical protein
MKQLDLRILGKLVKCIQLVVTVGLNLKITLEIPTEGSLPRANTFPILCYINIPKSFVAGLFFSLTYYITNF